MATRKEIHDEIAAAHQRDKLANEVYDLGYDEGKAANQAAIDKAVANAASNSNGVPTVNRPLGAVDPIYQNNPAVRAAAQEASANKPLVSEDIMNEILNRKRFSYNPNADALYQQYKDQYLTAGNIAMKDTMGKAAALTGGYGNTYAQAVGQQVYDDYAARAADKIPELEQLAYERWAREGDELRNNYDLLYGREKDADERAYRDRVLERQIFESDRDYNFNVEKFGKEHALAVRAQDLAEKVANHDMTMDELRFVLDEKVASHEMSMDDARLIMEKAESEAKIDKIRADIDLGYRSDARADKETAANIDLGYRSDDREERELTARINNSYYSGGNGNGGGNGKTPTADDEDPEPDPQTMSDKEVNETAKSLLEDYKNSRGSDWSKKNFYEKVQKKYKENAPYIMEALEKLRKGSAKKDKNITNKNAKTGNVIYAYTD